MSVLMAILFFEIQGAVGWDFFSPLFMIFHSLVKEFAKYD